MQNAVNDTVDITHPDNPSIRGVMHTMWTGAPVSDDADARAVVIAGDSPSTVRRAVLALQHELHDAMRVGS